MNASSIGGSEFNMRAMIRTTHATTSSRSSRACPNMSNDLFSLHSMFDLAPGAASVA